MVELNKHLTASPEWADSDSSKGNQEESPWLTELHSMFKPGWHQSPLLAPLKNCYDNSMTFAQLVRGATQDSDQFLPSGQMDMGHPQPQLQASGNKVDRDFIGQAINKWDIDKNGKLGLGELDKVIIDPAASSDEAALAYALKSNWGALNENFGQSLKERIRSQSELADLQKALPNIDFLNIGSIGVILDDSQKYSNQFGGSEGLRSFLGQNLDKEIALHIGDLASLLQQRNWNNMEEIEPNKPHSAFVSKTDLDQLIAGKSTDIVEHFRKLYGGDAIESGKYLKEHFEQFLTDSKGSDKAGLGDIQNWRHRTGATVSMWEKLQESFLEGKQRLDDVKNSSSELFTNKDHPANDIVPEAIRQGNIGDCYFLGSLAALANADPNAVAKLVSFDQKTGNYIVRFPGLAPESVKPPTALEMSMYAQASKHGIWGPVVEKAYGQYCNREASRRLITNPWSHNLPQDAAEGGSLQSALAVLTGKQPEVVNLRLSPYEQALKSAFDNHKRPVTAAVSGHMFAVTDYDAKTGSITVYDQQRPEMGRFKMSAIEIKQQILSFHIGQPSGN